MLIQLTDAGRALLDAQPAGVAITRADFGDRYNYVLDSNPSGLLGNRIYSANVVWQPRIVDPNTLKYSLYLGSEIPSFVFGEVALFNNATLIGVAVNATALTKVGPYGSNPGRIFSIDFFLDLTPGQKFAVGDVINDQLAFPRVQVPDQLTPPAINQNNAYIVYGKTDTDLAYLAFADPTGKWGFSSKPQIHIQGTITDVGTYGLQSLDKTGSYAGADSDLVIQFVSGTKRGYCRQVSSTVSGGFTWTTPLAELPEVGDSFIVVGPPVSGGGGSGGGSPFLTDILVNGLTVGQGNLVGFSSTAFGVAALSNNIGGPNDAFGYNTLSANTNGNLNVAIGSNALSENTIGRYNVAVGQQSASRNIGGNSNTSLGYISLSSITFGSSNVALGYASLGSSTTGSYNIALGYGSGRSITTGSNNVVLGGNDGSTIATLDNNIILSDGVGNIRATVNSEGLFNIEGSFTVNGEPVGGSLVGRTDSDITALGVGALSQATTSYSGQTSVGIGVGALASSTFAYGNTAVGNNPLFSLVYGTGNVALGNFPLYNLQSGYHNISIGYESLHNATNATTNVAIGELSLAQLTTGSGNTAIGSYSGYAITTGNYNVVIGHNDGSTIATADSNIILSDGRGNIRAHVDDTGAFDIIGSLLVNGSPVGGGSPFATDILVNGLTVGQGARTTGNLNTALGVNALGANTSGNANVAIGNLALGANTSGGANVAMGYGALDANTVGTNNTAIGTSALTTSVIATDNVAVGTYTMYNTTTGGSNTAVGSGALQANTTGNGNVSFGYLALPALTTGSQNVAIGFNALYDVLTGSNNVAIGPSAGSGVGNGNYNVIIGGNNGSSIFNLNNHVILSDGQGNIRAAVDNLGTFNVVGSFTVNGESIVPPPQIAFAANLTEETAAFAAGAVMVVRTDLLPLTTTTTAAPTTTTTTTAAPTTTTTTTTTAPPGSLVSDTFTGVDGTLLSAHTADSGQTWTRYTHTGTAGADETGTGSLLSNMLRLGAGASWSAYYNNWVPATPDYTVKASMVITTAGNCNVTVLGRVDPASGTYYALGYSPTSAGPWYLYKHVAGAETVLATGMRAGVNGTTVTLELVMSGSSIVGKINGVTVNSSTDSSITAAGRAGLRGNQNVDSTGLVSVDNFITTSP